MIIENNIEKVNGNKVLYVFLFVIKGTGFSPEFNRNCERTNPILDLFGTF